MVVTPPQPTTSGHCRPEDFLPQLRCDGLRVHADANTHRGGHSDLAQVQTLARSRLSLVQSVDQCSQVTLQLFIVERAATNGAVHDTGLVHTELHLTSLGVLHSRSHVGSNRAHLGVWHQATWAKDLTQGTHRSEEHTSELQSQSNLVCRLLL